MPPAVAGAKLTGIEMINAESTTVGKILVLQPSSTSVTSAGGDDAINSQRSRSVSSTYKVACLSHASEKAAAADEAKETADETNAAAEDEARRRRRMLFVVRPTKSQILRQKFNQDKMQAGIYGCPSLLNVAETTAATAVVTEIATNGNKLRADAQTPTKLTWK